MWLSVVYWGEQNNLNNKIVREWDNYHSLSEMCVFMWVLILDTWLAWCQCELQHGYWAGLPVFKTLAHKRSLASVNSCVNLQTDGILSAAYMGSFHAVVLCVLFEPSSSIRKGFLAAITCIQSLAVMNQPPVFIQILEHHTTHSALVFLLHRMQPHVCS